MSKPDQAKYFRDIAPPEFMENEQQLVHPVRTMIAEEAAKVGKTVLDVACNTCIDYPFMKAKGLEYTGVDYQEKFIKRARELHPGVDARVADALHLPFEARSYHTAYAKDLLEHLPPITVGTGGGGQIEFSGNYQDAIKEIWRVADRLMMLALFHEPGVTAEVRYHSAGFWANTYSKRELNECIVDLQGVDSVEYRSKVGSNHLYLVWRKK